MYVVGAGPAVLTETVLKERREVEHPSNVSGTQRKLERRSEMRADGLGLLELLRPRELLDRIRR